MDKNGEQKDRDTMEESMTKMKMKLEAIHILIETRSLSGEGFGGEQ
jgi:hypothetical protein